MHYQYRARNIEGREVKGTLRAPNEQRAEMLLRSNNLMLLQLTELKPSLFSRNILAGGVNTADLVLMTRQLAAMIRAGVPILESLRALLKQIHKPSFHTLLEQVINDIEDGTSLSQALAKYPATFSPFFLGVVRTGEASGRLSESLTTLSEYLEQNYVFMRKVRSALMYPVFVLTVVVVIVVLMFVYVMPQLVTLFTEAGVRLPWPTRILIVLTQFLQRFWYVLLVLAAILGIIGRSYLRTPQGNYTVSTLFLQIPVVSRLVQRVYLARLTSILHTLFSSDVPVIESLKIAQGSIGNKVYQRILGETADAVKDGAAISAVWEQEPFIPQMLSTMVAVGERSGEVHKSFAEAYRFFKRDVEDMLEQITVFIEPLLVIVLGIGVGFVVAGVLLPIYNLVLVI